MSAMGSETDQKRTSIVHLDEDSSRP
jgi:hypothetical protein